MTKQPELCKLPGTDLAVSPLCLGGNRLGSALDQAASFELLDAYVELGGNFIDTALVYADWNEGIERSCSERTLGRWLGSRENRKNIVIATKGGHPALNEPTVPRLDRKSLREDVQRSTENLGGAPIDLYYLHRDDPSRPIADIMESLQELVEEGAIRYYAASNFSAARLAAAGGWATERGVLGFAAHQMEWSLAKPRPEFVGPGLTWMDEALLEFHKEKKLTAIPYSSQAHGYFDKAMADQPLPASVEKYHTAHNDSALRTVDEIANRLDVDRSTVALAGLLHTPLTTVPVVGCRAVDQLQRSWAAIDLALDSEDLKRLTSYATTGRGQ